MNPCNKGALIPKFYTIQYDSIYTIISMQITDYYLFKIDNDWKSVNSKVVDTAINKIDSIDSIKKIIQSADKNAIQLLIVSYQIFGIVPSIFNPLLSKLKAFKTITANIHSNHFIQLTIDDIKSMHSIYKQPWKTIYINKLLKSHGLPTIIDDWNIIIAPQKYIFDDKDIDVSMRLLQLHNAIDMIKDDSSIGEIHSISQLLDDSIAKYNFKLPDICMWFKYSNKLPDMTIETIYKYAHMGIIHSKDDFMHQGCWYPMGTFILADLHGMMFDFDHVQSVVNKVYNTKKTITKDPILAFNCMTMYKTIEHLIETGSINKQAMIDCNNILKQIYNDTPEFKHNGKPYTAIDIIYSKHFGKLPSTNKIIASKSYDHYKYEYLTKYSYQFDFSV